MPTIEQVQSLLEKNQMEEALNLALSRETKDAADAGLHLAWADLLAELELFDEMLTELNLAVRDKPGSADIRRRLAECLQDNGQVRQAAACWREAIKLEPKSAEHYLALGRLLEEAGNLETAAKVYQAGLKQTGQAVFQSVLKGLRPPETEPTPGAEEQMVPQDTDLVRFCHLFEGREGVYARQWVGSAGKSGYTPVREPLTPAVAKNHLLGNYTIGIYPLRMDNTVRFMAFDLDVPSFEVARSISDRRAWEALIKKAHQAAVRIVEIAASHGLSFYIEDSGLKGRHCWLFFKEPVPGMAARKYGQAMLEKLDLSQEGVQVELFPKQAAIRGDGLGNLIKLPLGIHRVSGRRALFIDQEGRPYKDQLFFLNNVTLADRQHFFEVVRDNPPQQPLKIARTRDQGQLEQEEGEPKAGVRPGPAVVEEYDPERDPELQYLLLKCAVIRTIVEDLNRDGQVGHEESLVLAHTVGHLKNGPEAFNALMRRAVNADPAQFLKSRFKGNPVSCPKVRQRLPHLTSRLSCDCKFDPNLNLYPSPVRHVQTMSVEAAASGVTLDSMRFEQLLREYMKVKRQMGDMQRLLTEYETHLEAVFEESGAEELQTSQGTLKKVAGPDGRVNFMLVM